MLLYWLDGHGDDVKIKAKYKVRKELLVDFLRECQARGFNPVAINIPDDPADSNIEVVMEDNEALRQHLFKKSGPEGSGDSPA